jgi:tRNA threonylcarbamoyladenosine biosynthesis protein TsaE
MQDIQFTIDAINTVATQVIAELPLQRQKSMVLALSGDLGAGKTTFVQALGQQLGVSDPITSPTFTILQRYQTTHEVFKTLYHLDVYRLESLDELRPLQFDLLVQEPQTLICIEWAENIAAALPEDTCYLTLTINPDESRTLTMTEN